MDFNTIKASLTPNSAEYQRIHRWVIKNLGKANSCYSCDTKTAKKYEWSNISRNYIKDISDWQQLCSQCHRSYDGKTQDGLRRMAEANRLNSIGNKAHNTPVVSIGKELGNIHYWESLADASKALGVLKTSISNCLRERSNSAGGYYWHYAGKRG